MRSTELCGEVKCRSTAAQRQKQSRGTTARHGKVGEQGLRCGKQGGRAYLTLPVVPTAPAPAQPRCLCAAAHKLWGSRPTCDVRWGLHMQRLHFRRLHHHRRRRCRRSRGPQCICRARQDENALTHLPPPGMPQPHSVRRPSHRPSASIPNHDVSPAVNLFTLCHRPNSITAARSKPVKPVTLSSNHTSAALLRGNANRMLVCLGTLGRERDAASC